MEAVRTANIYPNALQPFDELAAEAGRFVEVCEGVVGKECL